ncbi:MAG TPA: hypothetical protein VLH77_06190 [Gammaproteobacteria bacterium]|nr:hypothetical protein [Gammaproteobacteria bacterium]
MFLLSISDLEFITASANAGLAAVVDRPNKIIYFINLSTNTVVNNVTVTGIPAGVAFNPVGSFLYASNGNNINVIDPTIPAIVATITGTIIPKELVLSANGNTLYVCRAALLRK